MKDKTIAAIATPPGTGSVAMIRVSGPQAVEICDKVFKSAGGKKLASLGGYRALYGQVYNKKELLDEAVCLVFRAPHSYTGEDVVEITCHGGYFVARSVLRTILAAGAHAAQAGEFSKRAFLNGKMDLSAAEGVMALINSQGEQGMQAALNALEGRLSEKISAVASSLTEIAAGISAWVDYPDEEIPEITDGEALNALEAAEKELSELIRSFDTGAAVLGGIETAIVGKTNAGKSTLMNLLSGYDRSIVTEIEGTTRDVVKETVNIGGCILRLSDTAGIRQTGDLVEARGIERSIKSLKQSALILAVFDMSRPLEKEDFDLISLCEGRKTIAVINKTDKPKAIDAGFIKEKLGEPVMISAKTGEGAAELEKRIAEACAAADFDPNTPVLIHERQLHCCESALESVREAKAALISGVTYDAVDVCIEDAISSLLELTGRRASAAVVEKIFSSFCVGK